MLCNQRSKQHLSGTNDFWSEQVNLFFMVNGRSENVTLCSLFI